MKRPWHLISLDRYRQRQDQKLSMCGAVNLERLPAQPRGRPRPYEAALIGNPMADPEKPLEAIRTIHSFDPCLACAIHTVDTRGKSIVQVKAL